MDIDRFYFDDPFPSLQKSVPMRKSINKPTRTDLLLKGMNDQVDALFNMVDEDLTGTNAAASKIQKRWEKQARKGSNEAMRYRRELAEERQLADMIEGDIDEAARYIKERSKHKFTREDNGHERRMKAIRGVREQLKGVRAQAKELTRTMQDIDEMVTAISRMKMGAAQKKGRMKMGAGHSRQPKVSTSVQHIMKPPKVKMPSFDRDMVWHESEPEMKDIANSLHGVYNGGTDAAAVTFLSKYGINGQSQVDNDVVDMGHMQGEEVQATKKSQTTSTDDYIKKHFARLSGGLNPNSPIEAGI